jgi:hypothetical protein
MGARNTKESNRRAQAAHAQRLRDAGLVRVSLWIRPEDRERVKAFVKKLARSTT